MHSSESTTTADKEKPEGEEEEHHNITPEETEKELSEHEIRLNELEAQVTSLQTRLLESQAERENIRRIAKRDVENAKLFGVRSFVKTLLDVADNLERAAGAVPEEHLCEGGNHHLKTLHEGVRLTERVMHKALGSVGVQRFHPLGERLDPTHHQAMFNVEDLEKEPGIVAVVAAPGYRMHDLVLRPAQVGVVKHPESAPQQKQEDKEEKQQQ